MQKLPCLNKVHCNRRAIIWLWNAIFVFPFDIYRENFHDCNLSHSLCIDNFSKSASIPLCKSLEMMTAMGKCPEVTGLFLRECLVLRWALSCCSAKTPLLDGKWMAGRPSRWYLSLVWSGHASYLPSTNSWFSSCMLNVDNCLKRFLGPDSNANGT